MNKLLIILLTTITINCNTPPAKSDKYAECQVVKLKYKHFCRFAIDMKEREQNEHE